MGELRRPAGGQKGRDTYGFPFSLNSCLSFEGTAVTVERRPLRNKGNGRGFFSSALYNTYSHFGYRTATQAICSTQARHTCAAQHVFLCQSATTAGCEYSARVKNLRGTVMPRLRGANRLCSSTVAEMRICGYHAVVKILCRSLFFYAYAVYHSHPR